MKKIIACALVAMAPLAAADAAAAKPKGKLKPRTFRMEIKGEQLTTWKYDKAMQPSCDWPEHANGRQYISFSTARFGPTKKPKVKISPRKGGGVGFKWARDDITMIAKAQSVRNFEILYSQMTPCKPGQGPFGGDPPPPDPIGTAKCNELGELDIVLGNSIEEVEHPSYPTGLTDKDAPASPLWLAGDAFYGTEPGMESFPAQCDADGQYNADIGITESQGEWAGSVPPLAGKLDARKLLGKGKKTVVELHRVIKYPNSVQTWGGPENTSGKTVTDATITFTPSR
jgi:hypothetical protein